jgi:hypothetical protein
MTQLTPSTYTARKFPPVLNKKDFVERYKAGEFGNCAPTWNSLTDWMEEGSPFYLGTFHIRNRIAGAPTFYSIPGHALEEMWNAVIRDGLKESDLYISAMAPHEHSTIQGELMQSERGSLDLFYSTLKEPMRGALLKDSHRAMGITCLGILRTYLCPKSYDWLQILLSRYPEHVIEFSSFSVEWGTLPGYNTCFWEVRQY